MSRAATHPVAAILLAAGLSRRMGGINKLLAPDGAGTPLVRRAATAIEASRARPVLVVTGHEADRIEAVLGGMELRCVHAPDYGEGMAASLRAGLAALPAEAAAVLVCLADMPDLGPAHLDRLIDAWQRAPHHLAALPVTGGQRGNPVLWSRAAFAALGSLAGDVGGRSLLESLGAAVLRLPMEDQAVLRDIDTPDELRGLS